VSHCKPRRDPGNWRKPPRITLPPVGDHFFVVYCVEEENPQARHLSPCAKHASRDAALAEAQRLAEKKPGRKYAVMETVDTVQVQPEVAE
jgi:hypothetical protein